MRNTITLTPRREGGIMSAALDVTEVTPRMRPYKAIRITEKNINAIADELGEYVHTVIDGDVQMSFGDPPISPGWWAVWSKGLTIDCNFYPDNEFCAMYKERGVAADEKWPAESLIILTDAVYEGVRVDTPEMAVRNQDGDYMLAGGALLTRDNASIRAYKIATPVSLGYAAALLDLDYTAGGASSDLREETWRLLYRQQMMNTRSS